MKIIFAPEALEDLEAAVGYIAENDAEAAGRLGARVFATIEKLAAGAFDGPEQTLQTGQRVRSWPVRPLRIYYVREEGAFVVLRVYHGRRRPI